MEVLMYSCKGTVTFVVLVTFTSSTEGRSNGTGVDLHGLSLPMKGTTARKARIDKDASTVPIMVLAMSFVAVVLWLLLVKHLDTYEKPQKNGSK